MRRGKAKIASVAADAPPANGFTLIELLVSLALLSFCATMLLGGVVAAGQVTRRSDRAGKALDQVAAAQRILRHRLEAMRPVYRFGLVDPTVDATGTESTFEWQGPPADRDQGTPLQKYRLMLTAPGDLVLFHVSGQRDDIDTAARTQAGWQATTLLRRAGRLSLAYYGATRDEPERRWRNFWQFNASPPEAIRIRIAFMPGDDRRWPDLVVRPISTINLECDPERTDAKCGGTR